MSATRYIVLCVTVLTVSLRSVNGVTGEEKRAIKSLVAPFLLGCGNEYGVSAAQIKAAKDAGTLKDLDPCIMSCVFKKMGIFDEKGMFSEANASELTAKLLRLDNEQTNAFEIIHACALINNQPVSDGDQGCERAKLTVDCYFRNKGSFPSSP